MQPNQLLNNVSVPAETVNTPVSPAVNNAQLTPLSVSSVNKLVSELSKDWKSPAFWVHLAVQVVAWIGFFSTTSNGIKIGAITLSGTSILGYLTHISFIKKYL